MADKIKYIYGNQFAQKLPGSNQNYYFRTITGYKVDSNGKPIEGTARTDLYYAPKPAARTSDGKTWTPGTADSIDNFNPGGWVRAGSTADNGRTYGFRNYSQEDADLGKIPPGKNVGDPVLGATAQQSLSTSGGKFYDAVQNNLINLAANTQPGLAQVISAKQANTIQSNNRSKSDQGADVDSEEPTPTDESDISEDLTSGIQALAQTGIPNLEGSPERKEYPVLHYPIDRSPTQDYIQFNMLEYGTRSPLENKLGWGNRTLTEIPKGYVTLPIQPTLSDQNSVDWNGLGLNAYQYGLASGAFSAMEGSDPVNQFISQIEGTLGEGGVGDALKTAIKLELAQQAVSAQGLLSRGSGAIVNPNLELLFQGPQLRPFNFTFRLSPRSKRESEIVLGIIRFFKEGMAPKKGAGNLFLKAPNVFKIVYKHKGDNEHPGLNKIKTCALQACTVDYTPDGSYMTFDDGVMTSYQLNLQFSELEPVYSSDYFDENGKSISGVGY